MIFFPRFPCLLVLASELDPSAYPNSVIEKDTKNENPFEEINLENNPDFSFLKKQQLQLEKLQELVQNLTKLVARLESQFTESPVKVKTLPLSPPPDDAIKTVEKVKEEKDFCSKEDDVLPVEGLIKNGPKASKGTVLKYNTFWPEKFHFVSAVKLRSSPTCLNVLPYRDHEGLSKYFAVGDDKGKLYIFLKTGDVSLEIDLFSGPDESSPITAIASLLSVFKNETLVVTGHENGVVVIHRVWDTLTGDEWNSLRVERIGRFDTPGGSRVNILEAHHVGRKRYILATDDIGNIRVLGEDGKLHGSVTPSRRPIAFLKQRLLFLTETGAGSLDLRTMKLKETECEGLNHTFANNYVFDAVDRTKAYGLTSEGDLVHTLLLGDVMNFKCRVRFKRKLDLDQPITALQAIRGYLLLASKEKVFVYNVSTQHYVRASGLRLLFTAGLDEITSSFLNQQQTVDPNVDEETGLSEPLIAGDYEKDVVLSLGNGYVALYRSNLPVLKNEFNSILWTSPVLFFIIFLFVAWHFFANKKDALTSWGPDDPFTASATGGASLGSGAGERPSYSESSRNSEIMDLRGSSGLRGSSRYISPPQYAGGPGNPYRAGNELDSRPGHADTRYRTNAELKYRGSHVEGVGVTRRRDALFVNSQLVDDGH
ncbi:uncharacterized membrane protein at1g75140 [Phtheirospermum japonicum]|uniref:Uncharacterized membrane protein at1g75140 n=1 Tax=Phtheirospermum japonicum TaxID=374723 RepID=A0A830CB38_9LAMI|nr:uncharacterized membrane protein at1g75140 [Phtheirospermum japonicum]